MKVLLKQMRTIFKLKKQHLIQIPFYIFSLNIICGCANSGSIQSNIKPVKEEIQTTLSTNYQNNNIIKDTETSNLSLKLSSMLLSKENFKEEINNSFADPKKPEAKSVFNFTMNNVPVGAVLYSLIENSSYNLIMSPDVTGNVTLKLKNVTAFDVLETLRNVYGYDYDVQDKKIIIYSNGIRTKIFTINYLIGTRAGRSELKIGAESLANSNGNNNNNTNSNSNNNSNGSINNNANNNSNNTQRDSGRIVTTVDSDFWKELSNSISMIIGSGKDRFSTVSPLTNTVIVKAMPNELIEVEKYLSKIQVIIDKQVVIEAKIIEVQLSQGSQSGINWSLFNKNGSINYNNNVGGNALSDLSNPISGVFGLVFQNSNFLSVLNFLETQGNLQVLSSPRIATMNNQKAILKVGTEEFFVTNVTTTSTSTAAGTTNSPSVTTQPFFSGIALDITPQIDQFGMITMHVRPSISDVKTVTKTINLGSMGSIVLPLASNDLSETDSVVKIADGNVVAIGGLMKNYLKRDNNKIPLIGDAPVIGEAFKNRQDSFSKYELVVLLKPQIITSQVDWNAKNQEIKNRLLDFDQPSKNIIINEKLLQDKKLLKNK